MARFACLGTAAAELAAAAQTLATFCQNSSDQSSQFDVEGSPTGLIPPDAPDQVHRAKRTLIANAAKIQSLLGEPADFLSRLAQQNQLLACLQWLGDFQILACIPLDGSVPFKDVANLVGVPETQLARVVRLTATAGFLQEAKTGYVAHSALSAPFVTQPAMLDAAMFLSETAAPAALHMSLATKRFRRSQRSNECAYNVAFNTQFPFADACEQRPKLQRQWPAFLKYGTNDDDCGIQDILTRLDWPSLGDATVVDVGATSTSTAVALANLHPALRFVVQTNDVGHANHVPWSSQTTTANWGLHTPVHSETKLPALAPHASARIIVHQRTPGTPQSEDKAAVYILRLPSPSPSIPSHALTARAISELRTHIEVLRKNPSSRLVLIARILPASGTVDLGTEAMSRVRDLSLLQLSNEREMEISEVVDVLNGIHDNAGGLTLTNELRSRNSAVVAFEVRYQAFAAQQGMVPQPARVSA